MNSIEDVMLMVEEYSTKIEITACGGILENTLYILKNDFHIREIPYKRLFLSIYMIVFP